jgi:hypothetical protein
MAGAVMSSGLDGVAQTLAALMQGAAPGMSASVSDGYGLQLAAPWDNPARPGERMWFGGVRRGKAYVSVHLMPVYTHADLAAKIPPALKKRMQGKSCFNFKAEDPALFEQLETLIRESAAAYAEPFSLNR